MSLSDGDKALVREVAREIASEQLDQLEVRVLSAIKIGLRIHRAECPAARGWRAWALVGVILVSVAGLLVGCAALLK